MADQIIKTWQEMAFNESYHNHSQNLGSRRKAHMILEDWIELVCQEKVPKSQNLTTLAKYIGKSRSTIQSYFNSVEEIQQTAIVYVRTLYQQYVIGQVQQLEGDPEKMLRTYAKASLEWPLKFPKYCYIWIHFLAGCTLDETSRALNTEAVNTGRERISLMIQMGQSIGQFDKSSDTESLAYTFQTLITGQILSEMCENQDHLQQRTQLITEGCLRLLKTGSLNPTPDPVK